MRGREAGLQPIAARVAAVPPAWHRWQAALARTDPTVWLVRDPVGMCQVLAAVWPTLRGPERRACGELLATIGAVAALPEPGQSVLVWREWEHWPVSRIAARLWCSPRQVYRWRAHALGQLAMWWTAVPARPRQEAVQQARWWD